jgi:hypothetical protein
MGVDRQKPGREVSVQRRPVLDDDRRGDGVIHSTIHTLQDWTSAVAGSPSGLLLTSNRPSRLACVLSAVAYDADVVEVDGLTGRDADHQQGVNLGRRRGNVQRDSPILVGYPLQRGQGDDLLVSQSSRPIKFEGKSSYQKLGPRKVLYGP